MTVTGSFGRTITRSPPPARRRHASAYATVCLEHVVTTHRRRCGPRVTPRAYDVDRSARRVLSRVDGRGRRHRRVGRVRGTRSRVSPDRARGETTPSPDAQPCRAARARRRGGPCAPRSDCRTRGGAGARDQREAVSSFPRPALRARSSAARRRSLSVSAAGVRGNSTSSSSSPV